MRLRVLLVEDSPVDAVLVERALAKGGCELALERVDTAAAFQDALMRESWDVILSDYSMPGWSGLDALAIARELAPDLPFVIVSGTIGEDLAVQAMQNGASDYLLKDRLTRLPAAVERAISDAEIRREFGRSRVTLAFLAQASVQLSESLDPGAVAGTLIALAVPLVADAATVHLVDEAGEPRRVATSDPDAAMDAETTDALVREAVHDVMPVMRDAAGSARSFVALPLVVRDAALGCLTLTLHGRSFRTVDGGLGVELAQRAALALQNARLYAQARAAVTLRDEFLQIAAHELRTPLTPLSLQVQTLLRSARAAGATVPVAHFDKEIEATGRHVQRLTRLVEQLLDVSRLGIGAPALAHRAFDLAALVRETVEAHAAQAIEAGCRVSVEAPGPVLGAWDRARLGQVLINLLANAFKFGAGKPIEVTLVHEGAIAWLTVRDHGVGIAASDQTRIFERFARAVSLEHYGGFGLGLWMAREIVVAHGGTITVASVPGAGATFTVEVPVGGADDQPAL